MSEDAPSDPSTQLDRFKAAAREAGCDDDPARVDERMKRLVAQRPKQDVEPRDRSERIRRAILPAEALSTVSVLAADQPAL